MNTQKLQLRQLASKDPRYTHYGEEIVGYGVNYLERFVATNNQTVFVLGRSYANGDPNNNVKVFVNGLRVKVDSDYEETSPTTITFLYPLNEDDVVRVRINSVGGTVTRNKHNHVSSYSPPEIVDGTNVIFTIPHLPKINTECVFKNGILMYPGNNHDYTISGTIITFNTAPSLNSKITVSYIY